MKKSILSLGGVAVLNSEEQKMVKGGTCGIWNGEHWSAVGNKAETLRVLEEQGGRWCCASCPWNQ